MMRKWLWVVLILTVAAGWKSIILAANIVPFNADEAVVGLMGRHILQGELPVFFYGQSYMGSLDAFLIALGFSIFGETVWVIRLVQGLLYLGVLITTIRLGIEAFDSFHLGVLAAGLLAIPTVNVSLYTTISLGGYGEAMFIGNLILIMAVRQSKRFSTSGLLLMGFLSGFGLWANGLTLVFTIPAVIYFIFSHRRGLSKRSLANGLAALILGAGLGALPWWIYGWQNGMTHLVGELLGSAVSVEQGGWLVRTAGHLVNLLLLGVPAIFGLRPPWGITWLAVPLIPLVLAAWGLALVYLYRSIRQRKPYSDVRILFTGVGITLFGGFLFTSFGVDPSGRYFLPLAVPLALIAADFILHSGIHPYLRGASLATILMFQIWGNLQCALAYPPGFTTQFDTTTIVEHRSDPALIQFLQAHGLTRGYSQYWIAYPLAFQSAETLIYTPRLPYHQDLRYTTRDNRYDPYNFMVESSDEIAYITVNNAALDEQIATGFTEKGIEWSEERIGEYHIFFDLTRAVRPEELDIRYQLP